MKTQNPWCAACLIWTALLAPQCGAQPAGWADNVLLPPSRVFAYTAQEQGAIRIYEVAANITITEAAAKTTLDIRIENMTDQRQEAELLLPVPKDAAVSGFAYDGPGALPSAQVLPWEDAVRTYNLLVARIKDPALVEFVGFNLIRTSIFPIEARARQRLVITYEHLLQVDGNRVDYFLPRTGRPDHPPESWQRGQWGTSRQISARTVGRRRRAGKQPSLLGGYFLGFFDPVDPSGGGRYGGDEMA